MNRRRFLAGVGAVTATSLTGCLAELGQVYTSSEPPVVSNRPDAVYIPTHVEGMRMVGMADAGGYRVGLFYSYPHRFWVVEADGDGFSTQKIGLNPTDDVHLMATVWEPETDIVVPVTGVSVELSQADELVSEEVVYPMLSQRMGAHYGDNFGLDGDGTYEVTVGVGAPSVQKFGSFADKFDAPAQATFDFEFSTRDRDDIEYTMLDEDKGKRGAVKPMSMESLPLGTAPDSLPGTGLGRATSGDLIFVGSATDDERFGDDPYLAISPRTPYNSLLVPGMGLSVRVESGSNTRFEGELKPGLDPELGFHYGNSIPGLAGDDDVWVSVDVPPQVARHEGYETAFLDFELVQLTLPES